MNHTSVLLMQLHLSKANTRKIMHKPFSIHIFSPNFSRRLKTGCSSWLVINSHYIGVVQRGSRDLIVRSPQVLGLKPLKVIGGHQKSIRAYLFLSLIGKGLQCCQYRRRSCCHPNRKTIMQIKARGIYRTCPLSLPIQRGIQSMQAVMTASDMVL